MKFRADVSLFGHAFAACAAARSNRTAIESLQNVHIKVNDGVATLTATDSENTIIVDVHVDCDEPGSALLPGDRLTAILRETGAEELSLELKDSSLKVKAGSAKYELPTADVDTFPLPLPIMGDSVKLDAVAFQAALRKTVFAADPNSSRYALGGVRVEKADNGLVLVATDGRRLSKVQLACEGELAECTIPARAALLMQKADLAGEVTLSTDSSSLQLAGEGVTIISRLLEGRFPSWKQVLPDLSDADKAQVNTGDLMRGIRQASIVVDKETRGVNVTLGDGKLSLSSSAAERGSATIGMDAEYLGENVTLKLDHVFVTDFLKTLDSDSKLTISLEGSRKSVVFDDGQQATYLVAPMV